jgi:hypothetical protein
MSLQCWIMEQDVLARATRLPLDGIVLMCVFLYIPL